MDEQEKLVEQLSTVSHFRNLPPADLLAIVSSGQVRRISSGKILFIEGGVCAGLHVLLKGKVELFKTGPEGQVTIINLLTPVVMFNEVPALDGGPNAVSARAVEDVWIWFLNCERLHRLLTRYPQMAMGLLTVLAKRNRMIITNYGDLSFRSATARVAKFLLELSSNGSQPINRGSHPIKTIAARIVAAPEAVSRILKLIDNQGLIKVDRKSIRVVDTNGLQELAHLPVSN
jgi:CRP/FNR family transcriptional regulator